MTLLTAQERTGILKVLIGVKGQLVHTVPVSRVYITKLILHTYTSQMHSLSRIEHVHDLYIRGHVSNVTSD